MLQVVIWDKVYKKAGVDSSPRGRSRAAATSKMECFVIIVNGWKLLTIIIKHSILDVAVVLDPFLLSHNSTRK